MSTTLVRSSSLVLVLALVACGGQTQSDVDASSGAGASFEGGPLSCSVSCAPTQTCCASSCVTLVANPFNCGTCGKRCGVSEACISGTCVAPPVPDGGGRTCAGPNSGTCAAGSRCELAEKNHYVCCPDEDKCSCDPICPT